MKTVPVAAAFLVCVLHLLGATTPPDQQLLVSATHQASLFQDTSSPFQLDVDFVAQIRTPVRGHLTLKWEAKDRWWRRIVMDEFEQVDIRNDDRLYTSRNTPFTPLRVQELIGLVEFADFHGKTEAKKESQRVENGVVVTCLEVLGASHGSEVHDICIHPASHDILVDEWKEPPDEQRREDYADYFDFGAERYPRQLELLVNGIKIITAHVVKLMDTSFDETLLVPPNGAIERRQCPDMKVAVPVRTPNPMYPESARQNGIWGDTTASMTVLADGSVADIQIIGSIGGTVDDATREGLKNWKFKPAMCGAEPVVSDIAVVLSVRLINGGRRRWQRVPVVIVKRFIAD